MTNRALYYLAATTVVGLAAMTLSGCTPSEQSCQLNQTAIGATVGAGAGAAIGALASHGNRWATLGAGAFGGAIGGIVGHQGDQACKQIAMQRAMELASAQYEASRRQAVSRPPKYQSVQWTNPTSGSHGTITPLNSYTDAASKQVCMSYAETDTLEGKPANGSGRVCKGPDGTWK